MVCENCRNKLGLPIRNSLEIAVCSHCGERHVCYNEAAPELKRMIVVLPEWRVEDAEWAQRTRRLRMAG